MSSGGFFRDVISTKSSYSTIEGSEIRETPVEVGSFFHIIYEGFYIYTSQVVIAGFLNHQQYDF